MKRTRGRARIGLLVPFTNSNLEPDMMLMCPEGVSLHVARMGGYDAEEVPDETQMHGLGATDLTEPLKLLMGVRPDVVMYGCTSATLTHGLAFDRDLAEKIKSSSGAETVTAAGALVHALHGLGVDRVGFASPYVPAINDMAISFLKSAGINVLARADYDGTLDNQGQGAMSPDDVFELGRKADRPDVQAIVLSCTDMRSVETLARLEDTLKKPVISSNQAMLYHAMQLLKIKDPLPGFGKLLERL